VRILDWEGTGKFKHPTGVVTTVLGKAGSNDIEMKSILINNGFDLDFPEEVLRESEYLSGKISSQEVAMRLDMREVPTFTIDPDDAKDFDDALSIRHLENGETEVGVHIADVTHYIKQGTPLDKEALKRSTSVYLVDRVLPMLPERLSNDLCSLRPNEDRLAYSAIFIFDKGMKIINRWFGRTVIH
ncbi:MAG: RNB domain-containing ribonuclease, partial [Cyclobacteriaceae bacterium]|nr:RNB domain-containing ribonuclease [Cyclobacteriaceae bacterium]